MATYRRTSDLPDTLALFPLPGALLFPRWQLPLNIFEPRYLNMIDDALAGTRLIGMVQSFGGAREAPDLARVGCAGRITSYTETDDGRYLLSLSGICRFVIAREIDAKTPYRQARADWSPYAQDLQAEPAPNLPDRTQIIAALQDYIAANRLEADWSAVETAPVESLINALCAGCPFSPIEKQALIEAPGLKQRAETLVSLLRMDLPQDDGGRLQ
jgi:uncharacterized protein